MQAALFLKRRSQGWGAEENMMKTTDELLVVYSVYKRENDL